jgi:hypothetical protein
MLPAAVQPTSRTEDGCTPEAETGIARRLILPVSGHDVPVSSLLSCRDGLLQSEDGYRPHQLCLR